MPVAVETRNLCKTYRVGGRWFWQRTEEKTVQALSDVNLVVQSGEIFGLIGRNGYGKTTLAKCIASLLLPTSGTAHVFGQLTSDDTSSLRQMTGWVGTEERSFYFRLTGRQNLRFFAKLQGLNRAETDRRIATLSERFGLESLLDRRFHEYSTGNKHKLGIVRGLLHDPRLLMLDEPTRSLDPFAADHLKAKLREWMEEDKERTIIITSHNLTEIEELSDRVGVMSRGHLRACGPVSELREKFGAHETITLRLDKKPRSWGDLEKIAPRLAWTDEAHGGLLTFDRQSRDDVLDRVVRRISEDEATLLSLDRQELRLQDIVDRIDQEDGPHQVGPKGSGSSSARTSPASSSESAEGSP